MSTHQSHESLQAAKWNISMHDIHDDLKAIEADIQVAKSTKFQRKAFVFDPDLEE